MVRWKLDCVDYIQYLDLTVSSHNRYVVCEERRDASPFEMDCLSRMCGFATFDQEVVFFTAPDSSHVDWFDLEACIWRPAAEFETDSSGGGGMAGGWRGRGRRGRGEGGLGAGGGRGRGRRREGVGKC